MTDKGMKTHFFHSHLWFPASDTDLWWFECDFRWFFLSHYRKKILWKKQNWSWAPMWNRVHPREFITNCSQTHLLVSFLRIPAAGYVPHDKNHQVNPVIYIQCPGKLCWGLIVLLHHKIWVSAHMWYMALLCNGCGALVQVHQKEVSRIYVQNWF